MSEARRQCSSLRAAALVLLGCLCSLVAAQDVGQLGAHLDRLRAEAAARPSSFEAAFQLGLLLQQLDHVAPDGGTRVAEALQQYERAEGLAPTPRLRAEVVGNSGALLLSAGRLEEAAAAMRRTLVLLEEARLENSATRAGTLFNLAKVQQQLGQAAEAQQMMGEAAKAARGLAPATYTKSLAGLKQPSKEQLAEMKECGRYLQHSRVARENATGQTPEQLQRWEKLQESWQWMDNASNVDVSWVFFALFQAYQQSRQFERAWRALDTGNRLQEGQSRFDPGKDEELMQTIQSTFRLPQQGSGAQQDERYLRLMQGQGGYRDPRIRPIFVVGMPRSGSTLLEQILASHSKVWGAGEDTLLAPLVPELIAALNSRQEADAAKIAAVGRKYIEGMRARLPPERRQAGWIVDKMLRNVWNLAFIAIMLPDACILHAVRHPADTGLSCYAQPFEGRGTPWATNLTNIAHQLGLVHDMMAHWDRVLPGRVLHVRYEDLVRQQEATTRRVLAHCGVPWEDSVLRFHETERAVATASTSQVRQALYRSSMGRWRPYAPHLRPLLAPLRGTILRYERDAGLDSSQQLLEQALFREAPGSPPGRGEASSSGSSSSGGSTGGSGGGWVAGRDEL